MVQRNRYIRRIRNKRYYQIHRYKITVRQKQYYLIDGDTWDYEIEETPLQSRAWVYQERLLAPRILHFGPTQLGWECKEDIALELFTNTLPPGMVATTTSETLAKALSPRSSDSSHESCRDAWSDLVNRYSKCDLTKREKKLIAFLGVDRLIEDDRQDEYLAGIWKSTLLTDLAWTSYGHLWASWEDTKFRAPTWSWLSLDRKIHFPETGEPEAYFADVVGTPAILAEGTIHVLGVLLPINTVEWSGELVKSFTVANYRFEDGWTDDESHLDLSGEEEEQAKFLEKGIFVLPVFSTTAKIFGMVVTRGHGAEYHRAGASQFQLAKFTYSVGPVDEGWVATPKSPKNDMNPPCLINLAAAGLFQLTRQKREVGDAVVVKLV
ncbi:hypothetical protein B0T10DRAFT_462813 [Thelonectria olida]|uniref:Heterokaryon incompatibility domain-containing protein n=1 Tax=Thelonectria olida TaxID=1576542 RepID=A0A9P8VXL8_9HYPO|nr:hypothetical protein B0T10DRAFT_462813 [Thelonectria olida]